MEDFDLSPDIAKAFRKRLLSAGGLCLVIGLMVFLSLELGDERAPLVEFLRKGIYWIFLAMIFRSFVWDWYRGGISETDALHEEPPSLLDETVLPRKVQGIAALIALILSAIITAVLVVPPTRGLFLSATVVIFVGVFSTLLAFNYFQLALHASQD